MKIKFITSASLHNSFPLTCHFIYSFDISVQVYFPIYWLTPAEMLRKSNVKISLKKLFTLPCFKIFNLSFSQKLFLCEMLAFVSIKTVKSTIAQLRHLSNWILRLSLPSWPNNPNLRLHERFNFCSVALLVSIIANYGVKFKCKYLIFVHARHV